MLDSDLIATKSRMMFLSATELGLAVIFERLFAVWISGVAALTFICALILALCQVIGWMHLLYIYAGISAVTLVLAGLVYVSKRD